MEELSAVVYVFESQTLVDAFESLYMHRDARCCLLTLWTVECYVLLRFALALLLLYLER